jgi:hypothetical protein
LIDSFMVLDFPAITAHPHMNCGAYAPPINHQSEVIKQRSAVCCSLLRGKAGSIHLHTSPGRIRLQKQLT